MTLIRGLLSTSLCLGALTLHAPSQAMPAKEFNDEINKVYKQKGAWKTASLYWLLQRDDLTDDQRRRARLTEAGLVGSSGDSLYGSVVKYLDYARDYPDAIDQNFIKDINYRVGQYHHTALRAMTAPSADMDWVRDLWRLGYWFDTEYQMRRLGAKTLSRNSVLIQAMERTQFLCGPDKAVDERRLTYTLNNKETQLAFCEDGHTTLFPSPREWAGEDPKPTIEADYDALMARYSDFLDQTRDFRYQNNIYLKPFSR